MGEEYTSHPFELMLSGPGPDPVLMGNSDESQVCLGYLAHGWRLTTVLVWSSQLWNHTGDGGVQRRDAFFGLHRS